MIKFNNQVPSVYPSASRDFQYLARLIDIVLNSVKHNVDDVYELPNLNTDTRISELLALALGFKLRRNYDKKQLAAIVAILPSILKYKGTIYAVEIAAEALINASGALTSAEVAVKGAELVVTLPKSFVDIALFSDLLDYILPAGMTCKIIRKDQMHESLATIVVDNSDTVTYEIYDDTELATLFDFANDANIPDLASNIINSSNGLVLNAGLLNNTIIPVLNEPLMPVADLASADELSAVTDAEDE